MFESLFGKKNNMKGTSYSTWNRESKEKKTEDRRDRAFHSLGKDR